MSDDLAKTMKGVLLESLKPVSDGMARMEAKQESMGETMRDLSQTVNKEVVPQLAALKGSDKRQDERLKLLETKEPPKRSSTGEMRAVTAEMLAARDKPKNGNGNGVQIKIDGKTIAIILGALASAGGCAALLGTGGCSPQSPADTAADVTQTLIDKAGRVLQAEYERRLDACSDDDIGKEARCDDAVEADMGPLWGHYQAAVDAFREGKQALETYCELARAVPKIDTGVCK